MAFTRYKNRRGLAADWVFHNPVLEDGELGYEKNTGLHKIGDGSTNWVNLPYAKTKALDVIFTPAGMVASTNAQAAIEELWVEKSATSHTHGASGSQTTSGAGLPGFTGRAQGDQHYDTTAKKEYTLTGVVGVTRTDTFTRADSTSVNPPSDGGANYTQVGTVFSILNNQLRHASGTGVLALDLGAGSKSAALDLQLQNPGASAGFTTAMFLVLGGSGAASSGVGFSIAYLNATTIRATAIRNGSTGAATFDITGLTANHRYEVVLEGTGAVGSVVKLYVDGVFATSYVTDVAATGNFASIDVGSGGTNLAWYVDNLVFKNLGTLAWTDMDTTVPTHTHTGSIVSQGAGLPTFTGRSSGDQHYDTTAKKEYTLTGVAGETASDPLNYTGILSGKQFTANSVTYTWVLQGSGNPAVTMNGTQYVYPASGTFVRHHVTSAGINTAPLLVSIDMQKTGGTKGAYARGYYLANYSSNTLEIITNASGYPFSGTIAASFNLSTNPAWTAVPNDTFVRVSLQIVGSVITASVSSTDGSVVYGTVSYTDPAVYTTATGTGQTVGFMTGSGGGQTILADNFSFTNLGTLAWTEMGALTLASRSGFASLTTLGSGLPAFASRLPGDGHFNTDINRLYVMTGAFGKVVNDTFDRTNTGTASLGTSSSGEPWILFGGSTATAEHPQVLNNRAVPGTLDRRVQVELASADMTVAGEFTPGNNDNIFSLHLRETSTQSGYDFFMSRGTNGTVSYGLGRSGSGNVVFVGTSSVLYTAGQTYRMEASAVAGVVNLKITRLDNGQVLTNTYTDSSPLTGTRAGFRFWNNLLGGVYLDNFEAFSNGTLKWEASEPVYLQAQLASGNVATGTHVLKPGLRVPAVSTLKEIVLRCETAPTGGPITVAVERFNNGVSAGVIGTASIPAGDTVGSAVNLTGGCAKGDILKFNITSVGSTVAGADLTISLDLR